MKICLALIALALTSACATSQMRRSDANGGRVLVLGSKGRGVESGIKDAHKKMAEKCPTGYTVVEEGWESVPSVTGRGNTDEKYFDFKCNGVAQK